MASNTINFARLRNEEYTQFHLDVSSFARQNNFADNALSQLYQLYTQELSRVQTALDVINKSPLTEQLNAADEQRDRRFRGLSLMIEGNLYHFVADKRLAAERLDTILQHYGDLAVASRNQETAGLTSLIADLRGRAEADLRLLDLLSWVDELEQNNNEYETLARFRVAEQAASTGLRMKEERKAMDAQYRLLITAVQGTLALNPGDADCTNFMQQTDALIGQYKTLIAERYGHMQHQAEPEQAGQKVITPNQSPQEQPPQDQLPPSSICFIPTKQ